MRGFFRESGIRIEYLLAALLIVLGAAIAYQAGRDHLADFLADNGYDYEFLIVFVLASIFPASALSYHILALKDRFSDIRRDLDLLGMLNNEDDVQKFEDRFNRTYNPANYALFTTLASLSTAVGLGLFFWPPRVNATDLLDDNTLLAMRYGFLGAYVFSVQLVYRRYTTLDLQPTVYMNCTLLLIAGLIFTYTAFTAISGVADPAGVTEPATGAEAGLLAIVSFSLGYFPYLAIRWFNQLAYTRLGVSQRRADNLPLGLVDGISQFHETRLLDEGIDNVQNLASVNIDVLLIDTRFSAHQVIEWVDQAILYQYLSDSEIESFRSGGIRTITDLRDYWQDYRQTTPTLDIEPQDPWVLAREKRADLLQTKPERLDVLFCTTANGPNMPYIREYWERLAHVVERTQEHVIERLCRSIVMLPDSIQHADEEALIKFKAEFLPLLMSLDKDKQRQVFAEISKVVGRTVKRKRVPDAGLSTLFGDIATLGKEFDPGDLSRDESSPEMFVGRAWLAKKQGNYGQAVESYEKAIELDPKDPVAYNELAWLFATERIQLGIKSKDQNAKLQQALEWADRAVQLSGGLEPAYLDTRAKVKIELAKISSSTEEKRDFLEGAKADLAQIEDLVSSEKVALPAHGRKFVDERKNEVAEEIAELEELAA